MLNIRTEQFVKINGILISEDALKRMFVAASFQFGSSTLADADEMHLLANEIAESFDERN